MPQVKKYARYEEQQWPQTFQKKTENAPFSKQDNDSRGQNDNTGHKLVVVGHFITHLPE
ncbi:hypothetical protein D3C81_1731620 [compost metagenome]